MKILLRTLLACAAHVAAGMDGSIVYPIIINERSESGTKAKLAITPTHLLDMDQVSILGDTYYERMEINGTTMDLLLDSATLQKNMYECRLNMATYTINVDAGKIYVEGVINVTHAISPIKHTRKPTIRIPHRIFRITEGHSFNLTKAIAGNNTVRFKKTPTQPLRNGTNTSEQELVRGRDLLLSAGALNKLARDMKFEIEVHCVLDTAMGEVYNSDRKIARYTATLMNIVNLKIKTMKQHKMSVRVVGIRQLNKKYESQAVVLKDEYLNIHETLRKLSEYTLHDPILSNADMVILLTGREAAGVRNGKVYPEYNGLAYNGQVCKQQQKVAVVEDKGAKYLASIIIPHEMGHLLGAPHDGPDNEAHSNCPVFGAIMAPEVEGSSGHRFSDCAEESIKDNLERMNDYRYWNCICVRNLVQDFLEVQKHLAPPNYKPDDFCKATEGSKHYYSELENCIVHCYHGGFWSGYPGLHYPAPYGFRCAKNKICMFGECVPCSDYKPMYKDCETS